VAHCQRCLALEGVRRADVLVLLGNLHNALGQPLDACAAYQEALRVAPDDGEIYHNLACTQDRLGDLDAAVENYRTARRLSPHIPDTNLRNAIAKLLGRRARTGTSNATTTP
jgi:Flp pilus assembly protein TadD